MRSIFFTSLVFTSFITSAQSTIIWSAELDVATSAYENLHPRIITVANGNPVVIWGRSSDESVFISRWNSLAFTTPVKLNPSWLTVATASWMGPDIATKGDTVYVVMKQTPEADVNSHIYIVSSFDGGMSFSLPVQLDNIADSISRFPTITTDANGNPIVAFMKFDNMFMNSRWAVTKSSDYGNTFSPDVKASGWSGADALVCDCCPGAITCEGNNVAMLYRNNQNNIRDSWVGISTDGGSTFIDGWNVDQNNWNLFACPSTGPDGVIIGDSLYSVFMNGANDDRVYRNTSIISSATAQPSQLLTGSIAGLNSQNYPRIDNSGNAIAITWKQTVNGQDQLPLLFTSDIANGFPIAYDTVDLNDITNADVALSNGNIFVAWQDDNSGTVKYRTGTYSVSTPVSAIAFYSSVATYPNPSSGELLIRLDKIQNASATYTVLNFLGQNLIESKSQVENNLMKANISTLAGGTYLLKIVANNQTFTAKIIKE